MSEAIIFGIGAVMFIFTTGATVTFGMFRAHELQLQDIEASERTDEIEEHRYTEIYRTQRLAGDAPETLATDI